METKAPRWQATPSARCVPFSILASEHEIRLVANPINCSKSETRMRLQGIHYAKHELQSAVSTGSPQAIKMLKQQLATRDDVAEKWGESVGAAIKINYTKPSAETLGHRSWTKHWPLGWRGDVWQRPAQALSALGRVGFRERPAVKIFLNYGTTLATTGIAFDFVGGLRDTELPYHATLC
ncbi:methylthioribose-1-phosphate isomerase [Anopheles sinensis]|uniref:Methylthioribose-1-phosphate isomerase n=1 Tax=Anopheles sinensis TaxID=74873 RepID=A0A084W936_ANOSI|nr:methylthioribose-1-phosphate isomerase [Anopheles sinensis]